MIISPGQLRFLDNAKNDERFSFVEGDLLDEDTLSKSMEGFQMVFHFATNADVRFGTDHPRRDLEQIPLRLLMFWKLCVIRAFAKLHLHPLDRFMVKQKSFQHLKMHRFRFRPLFMPPQNLQESL